MYGYSGKTLPVRWGGGPLLQIAGQGGPAAVAAGRSERAARPDASRQPTVIARFTGGDAGVLSGLMRGADQIRNRPAIVDAPVGKGRVILFVNNPIYRWQTFGEHAHGVQRAAVSQRSAGAGREAGDDDRRAAAVDVASRGDACVALTMPRRMPPGIRGAELRFRESPASGAHELHHHPDDPRNGEHLTDPEHERPLHQLEAAGQDLLP